MMAEQRDLNVEGRLSTLEAIVPGLRRDIGEIKTVVKEVKESVRRIENAWVTTALKGFGWIIALAVAVVAAIGAYWK